MSADVALQKAIKAAIEADSTIISLWGGAVTVYDTVPDESPLPYIYYEAGTTNEWDVSEADGWECLPRIHVFDNRETSKFAREVSGAIESLLHNNPLVLSGYRCVLLQRLGSQSLREPDGQVQHSLTSFRALIEET